MHMKQHGKKSSRWVRSCACVVSVWLSGCARTVALKTIHYPNPCSEYVDLLRPVYERVADPSLIDAQEEMDRQVCLQSWIELYRPPALPMTATVMAGLNGLGLIAVRLGIEKVK